MNEFTKEELKIIKAIMRNIEHCYFNDPKKYEGLKEKIQSMIERHKEPCVHDWRESMCDKCYICDEMREY